MKQLMIIFAAAFLFSCNQKQEPKAGLEAKTETAPLQGTWKLLTGTIIEKGDTTITDYTKNRSFIKIINATHFAFLNHTLRKDTTDFSAGGGPYKLEGNNYTEHLEYCNAKSWEGGKFSFTVTINGDTLIQQGIEKVEAEAVERLNIEKYVRVK